MANVLTKPQVSQKFKHFPIEINLGGVMTDIITVTPEIAASILNHNNNANRKVSKSNVSFLHRQMDEGKFKSMNGESIKIDTNGDLIDGQHRLIALVQSGVTLDFLFVFGLPPESKETIDTGKTRSASDVLSFSIDSPYTMEIASSARMVILHNKGKYSSLEKAGGKLKPSNSDILEFVQDRPNFPPFVESVVKMQKNGNIQCQKSILCSAWWIINQVADHSETTSFFHKFITGIGITSETDSVYVLRKHFARLANKAVVQKRATPAAKLQAIIQAWNHHVSGKPCRLIKLSKEFPKIKAA